MTTAKPAGGRNVLIVENDTLVALGVKTQLEKLGHRVAGQASTAAETLKLFRELKPDLLLMDIRLNDDDGIAVLAQVLKERRVPAIIISAFSDQELIERAGAAGVFGYLIKPVTVESLAAQIEVAVQRFNEQEKLKQEKDALSQTLEERKIIEKAKGIFMRRLDLDEPEAHKRLQQESQKRRIPMVELAKRIIESEEMMGGS